jgi:hypothetical protein
MPRYAGITCVDACSPGWTRTSNPSVNSRMLCQLSYRGPLFRGDCAADRGMTLAYVSVASPILARSGRTAAK